MTFVGVFAMAAINLGIGIAALLVGGSLDNGGGAIAAAAVLLALIAFGGGFGLIALRRPWAKGLGLGAMIGWALISVISAGWCTGLNPGLYA